MKTVKTTLMVALLTMGVAAHAEQLTREPDAWRTLAASIRAGAQVSVRLKDGREFSGVIVEVRDRSMVFKPRTRIAVPAGEIAFTDVDSIVERKPGMSPGSKVAIGVGSAAGAVLLLALAALANSY